jgi:hypothetical protein
LLGCLAVKYHCRIDNGRCDPLARSLCSHFEPFCFRVGTMALGWRGSCRCLFLWHPTHVVIVT